MKEMRYDAAAAFAGLPDPAAFAQVVRLGVADREAMREQPRKTCSMIAARSRDLLLKWTLAELDSDAQTADDVRLEIGLVRFATAFATHYLAAMERLVPVNDEWLGRAIVHPDSLDALGDQAASLADGLDEPHATQAMLAGVAKSLLGAWTLIAFIRHATARVPDADLAEMRAAAVEGLAVLFQVPWLVDDHASPIGDLVTLIAPDTAEAVVEALRVVRSVHVDVAGIGHAALRVGDIPRLARREPTMREAYGMPIERALERQLALLFTSLGFAVVESTPGKRYVDLLCIAPGPEPATVVVEAKSTAAREYVLRADDQRALAEHVHAVRRSLRGLPPMKLVLVVAPAFSAGAARRMEAVGRELGLPCHGFPAPLLANLRAQQIGHIPFDILHDAVTEGPRVVDTQVIDRILRIAESPTEGWRQLIATQRRARA